MANVAQAERTNPREEWSIALRVLRDLLEKNKGLVSSIAVGRELKKRLGVSDALPLIVALSYVDKEDLQARGMEVPAFSFHHRGRSFYSPERYEQELREAEVETEREAEVATESVENAAPPEEPLQLKVNKLEEARLTTYVKSALDGLYDTELVSEELPKAFDVHSERPGSVYENVDILAVQWRSESVVDLVTVEVKLDFTADAVHQAMNYLRFSNRVWIAVRVSSDASEAGKELRAKDPRLFDYVVGKGLGVLACRRRQGGKYEVFPVQWPAWSDTDPLEREQFVGRYRARLVEAGVIEEKNRQHFPALR